MSLDRLSPWALALLRIVAALLFIEHGTQKFLGFPASPAASGTVSLFSLMGLASIIEIGGGLLVLVGKYARPAAFVMSGMMATAYWMAHGPRSFFPVLNGGDAAILFCFVFLYIAVAGPGACALDGRRG